MMGLVGGETVEDETEGETGGQREGGSGRHSPTCFPSILTAKNSATFRGAFVKFREVS